VRKSFKLRNEASQNFKLQVNPPFTFSDSVRNIALEDSRIPAGTDVFVTGWGRTWVSQYSYIQYYEEHQLTFCQNANNWTTTYHNTYIT